MAKLFRYKQMSRLRDFWGKMFIKFAKKKNKPNKNKYYELHMNAANYCRLADHPMWYSNNEECKQMRKECKEFLRNTYKKNFARRSQRGVKNNG